MKDDSIVVRDLNGNFVPISTNELSIAFCKKVVTVYGLTPDVIYELRMQYLNYGGPVDEITPESVRATFNGLKKGGS
jgi:hypothetical protein